MIGMARNPTMNDVAHEARVALKTVSRFVNGQTNIDPALSERIRLAIETLGYRRNLAAASIRPGYTSKVLGLIISDLANPYYSTLTRAIETFARQHGYLLISASSDEEGVRHDELVDRLMEQQVDGLLIVPPRDAGRDWASVRPPIPPVVFLDRPVDYADGHIVLADNAGGARSATKTLVDAGARRIAFVGDKLSLYTMQERYEGYVAALTDAGIAIDDRLILTSAHDSAQARDAVMRLFEETDFDGVFAANNRASVGSLLAFRSANRRVPLVGFDDFEAALLSDPQVSVVSQDVGLMGERGAEILLQKLGAIEPTELLESQTLTVPTSLVLRGSER